MPPSESDTRPPAAALRALPDSPVLWAPALSARGKATKHRALTERIIADIDAGVLRPGMRMPTHRDLAHSLGVSIQTVSLSYREAEQRGYLRGEVGRGTFVRPRVTERAEQFMLDRAHDGSADLSIIRAAYTQAHEDAARAIMAELSASPNAPFMQPCRPIAGLDAHRAAGMRWLRGFGLDVPAERVLITNGAAHGLFLAVSSVVRAGDVVLTEDLTDHGIIGLASVLGFTLRGLATDAEGILPAAFEAACAAGKVTALVLIPTLTNPTSHVAGAQRRRDIAVIARRFGVFVIEDEVCRPLIADELPSITGMLPDLGFFVTSFTKSVMTGLRTGYLVVPPAYGIRVASILRVTGWSATNLTAEIAARWVEDGTAERLLVLQRREIAARQKIAMEELGDLVASTHPASLCAWLKVPAPWSEEALVRTLAQRDIAITPSEPFVAGERGKGGIRVCFGGRLTYAALRTALITVRSVFTQLPPVYDVGALA